MSLKSIGIGHFQISGVISLVSTLDFETTPSYTLTIGAYSSVGSKIAGTVTINVADKNDNIPIFGQVIFENSFMCR